MSGAAEDRAITGAKAIAQTAASWLERSDRPDWNEADQRAFDAWLEESPAHRLAYWRVKGAWGHTDRLAALRPRMGGGLTPPPRRTGLLFRVAAGGIAAVVIGAVASGMFLSGSRDKVYSTGLGVRETITLPDGSQIELNTDTAVRVAEGGLHRHVTLLRGEAYFQIRHNAAHPFIVLAGNQRVVDLGTKFLVREDAGRVEVTLVEGRARIEPVEAAVPSRSATLAPGDVAVASARSLKVTSKPVASLSDELGWRRGVLVFRRTTLAEAAAQFNRYNAHKLVIEDGAAGLQIGGIFQANNPELFARVAQDVLGLKITHRGGETAISH